MSFKADKGGGDEETSDEALLLTFFPQCVHEV